MDFEKLLKSEIVPINEELKRFMEEKKEHGKQYSKWHVEYYDNILEYLSRGGKRLRPTVFVHAYHAVGAKNKGNLYRAAISVELLHNGSLLHDDLIDHDEFRRGGPTFHAKYRDWFKDNVDPKKAVDFGSEMGILGGDSLINLGNEAISTSGFAPELLVKLHRYYSLAFNQLIDGVFLETMMIWEPNVTVDTYIKMIEGKTASLFEKSILMGATLGGASESQLEALSEYAIKTGEAFQIQDDILGTFGDIKVTGKPADGDIKEGKRTILVIRAYEKANDEQKKILDTILGHREATPEQVEQVREVFRQTGALEFATELGKRLNKEAMEALDRAEPKIKDEYVEFFKALNDFMITRNF